MMAWPYPEASALEGARHDEVTHGLLDHTMLLARMWDIDMDRSLGDVPKRPWYPPTGPVSAMGVEVPAPLIKYLAGETTVHS